MGRSTVWTSRVRRASSEWERELFVEGMSRDEVRGALYDVTRTIDHLRISLAAVCQVADSWGHDERHRETVALARQRLTAAVEKLKPIAQDLQAAFYAFEDVAKDAAAHPHPQAVRPPQGHHVAGHPGAGHHSGDPLPTLSAS